MLTYIIAVIVAGVLVSVLMGLKTTLLQNAVLGIVGSIIGEHLFTALGFYSFGLISKIITSFIGACIFVFLITFIFSKKKR